MKFNEVANIFEQIEKTSSRNEITTLLSNFYKSLTKEEGQILSYMVLGRVAPFFVNSEFNYSEKSLLTLLSNYEKVHLGKEEIKEKRVELGDIGDTTKHFCQEAKFKSQDLTIREIYDTLWDIVNIQGSGSVEKKNTTILDTLQKLSPLESKYFVRIICGQLRFGISFKTLLDVFSFLISGNKDIREELDRAYGVSADIGYIYSIIAKKGLDKAVVGLNSVKLQPGIPVLPRLVERVGKFEETFERTGVPALVQSKYDGLRCQIHKYESKDYEEREYVWAKYIKKKDIGLFDISSSGVEVKLFTRNLEDITDMFPEIVESAKLVDEKSFILDSEVLGFKDGTFLSFQETMQRRRKYGVTDTSKDIPVKGMVFDVLYLNNEDLLSKDTVQRVEVLESIKLIGSLERCETKRVETLEGLMEIFYENVDQGYEGVIVKMKTGGYLPGVRNYDWIKLKKSMMNALVDTVDLVCVGYYYGSGRRSDLGVGAVLGALYNEKMDVYEAICKVGTGISDEQLKDIRKQLDMKIKKEQPESVLCPEYLKPDVWVYPDIVFSVEADEITSRLGQEEIGGGLSLRFPRLIEWDRDKSATDATRVTELEEMFKMVK